MRLARTEHERERERERGHGTVALDASCVVRIRPPNVHPSSIDHPPNRHAHRYRDRDPAEPHPRSKLAHRRGQLGFVRLHSRARRPASLLDIIRTQAAGSTRNPRPRSTGGAHEAPQSVTEKDAPPHHSDGPDPRSRTTVISKVPNASSYEYDYARRQRQRRRQKLQRHARRQVPTS